MANSLNSSLNRHPLAAFEMKKILVIVTIFASAAALSASEFERHVELEQQILGDWLAAEYFVAQPPPELQQFIKSISFQTNNIAMWDYVQDGKVHKAKGRYGIYSFPKDKMKGKEIPTLIVAPMNFPNASVSSQILLTLSDFELDFDSRFLRSWGKLIKAKGPDGKRVLFIRKGSGISRQQPTER